MNDLIEIVILSYEDSEEKISIEQEILLRSKILGKANPITISTENFCDYRKIKLEPYKANKAKKIYLDRINKYFDKVLNYIENKELTPMGKNNAISFGGNSIDPDDFGTHNIPNSHTNELRNGINENSSRRKINNGCNENCCADTPCATVCIIF